MQEEVTQKTVTFCIRTTKITADLLKKVLLFHLLLRSHRDISKHSRSILDILTDRLRRLMADT